MTGGRRKNRLRPPTRTLPSPAMPAKPAKPQPNVAKRMESAWSLLPLWRASVARKVQQAGRTPIRWREIRALLNRAKRMESFERDPAASLHRHRDRFLHQHDGNVMPNRVKKFAIGPQQAAVDLFLHRLAGAILQAAGGDFPVYLLNQRRFGDPDVLMRLRTAQNFQQLGIEPEPFIFVAGHNAPIALFAAS